MVIVDAFVSQAIDPFFPIPGFVGNGYFGMVISQTGIGPMNPVPLTLVAGIYQNAELFIHPLMREVHIWLNGEEVPITHETVQAYSQVLDRKTALVTTEFDIAAGEASVHVKVDIFASGTRMHVGAMHLEVTPAYEGSLALAHGIDTTVCSGDLAVEWQEEGELLTATFAIREDRKVEYTPDDPALPCAAACCWRATPKPIRVESTQDAEIIAQTLRFAVQPGKTITIDKFFSYVTGREHQDPSVPAVTEVLAARDAGFAALFEEHAAYWAALWTHSIEVPDPAVSAYITASLYSIYASLRPGINWSLGPNGLGGYGWSGHVFWDADLWVFLGLCLLHPDLSRCITDFRRITLNGAVRNRMDHQARFLDQEVTGAKYPWQATSAGVEKAPDHWGLQEHITADVAFGQYYDWLVSGDEAFLNESVWHVFKETSDYWASRVELGEEDGIYHLRGVIPPDEHVHPGVCIDNAFTNVAVMWVLQRAVKIAAMLGEEVNPAWAAIMNNLYVPYDPVDGKILEFADYQGTVIKQADTDLITFPLEWPVGRDVEEKNMHYYREKLPPVHIAMSSGIYSIVAAQLDLGDEAWELFADLFPHFREPLTIMSETPENACAPFTTGCGGFLMALIYGFCGLRIREDGLLLSPRLPPALPEITLRGLAWRGQVFDLTLTEQGKCAEFRPTSGSLDLVLFRRDSDEWDLDGEAVASDRGEPGARLQAENSVIIHFTEEK